MGAGSEVEDPSSQDRGDPIPTNAGALATANQHIRHNQATRRLKMRN
jgi:hypothetical protein